MFKTNTRTVAALMSAAVIGATTLVAVPAAQAESNVTYNPGTGYEEVPDQGSGPSANYGYSHYPDYRYGAPVVGAGIVGSLFGTVLGAVTPHYSYARPYARNAEWCSAHYRSYTPATGTFTGFDGMHHPCP